MASHHLTAGQVASTTALERYLGELSARLRGPRAARTRVLAEIRDGLTETVDAHLANGIPPDVAATTAIAQFGDPATVARSSPPNWPPPPPGAPSPPSSRPDRWSASGGCCCSTPHRGAAGSSPRLSPSRLCRSIALAIATAAGTFATTGRLIRWLPETPAPRALTATIAIAALCLAADLTVLGVLAAHLAAGGHLLGPLIAAAVTASILRIAAATTAIRSTRLTRNRLRSD